MNERRPLLPRQNAPRPRGNKGPDPVVAHWQGNAARHEEHPGAPTHGRLPREVTMNASDERAGDAKAQASSAAPKTAKR